MSKTISINAGSSSLKWQLYQMPEETVLAKGLIERIGLKDSISTVKFDGRSEPSIPKGTDTSPSCSRTGAFRLFSGTVSGYYAQVCRVT